MEEIPWIVLSPRKAPRATRALKSGVKLRRLATSYSSFKGWNTPYHPVRFSGTTSKFAGVEIDTFEKLILKLRELIVGDSVDITVIRQGKSLDLTMKTVKWTAPWQVKKGMFASVPSIGLTLTALTTEVRERFGLRWGSTGVVITLSDQEKATSLDLQHRDTHGDTNIFQKHTVDVCRHETTNTTVVLFD